MVPQPALAPLRRWDPERIGPFALLGRLGAGAMGQVYLGRSTAGRLVAVKTIKIEFADEAGFRAEAQQGREMGFDGKTLIHPSQVAPANELFGPSEKELADARKIVSAYEQAQAAGNSVITVDGRMIESLHVRDAQRILALADRISQLESQ